MTAWKPIATLTDRQGCTDYLVATKKGDVRLLWWIEEDRHWLPDSDREEPIPEDEVLYWLDYPKPPIADGQS